MKKGHIYTLVFMLLISAALTLALAAAYEGFKPAINKNAALQEQRAVLYALGLDTGLKDVEVAAVYVEKISEGELNGVPVLVYGQGGPQAYAVPFEGSALWGALKGYLGVKASLDEITGLVFTYQNETPGLGGRIDEEAYKEQFRGLPISPGTRLSYGTDLDAVTGATQTSAAVLRTLNKTLSETVFPGEVK
jgi:Na+-transporting NADH:ubiquinone oxidoreductase subunit C